MARNHARILTSADWPGLPGMVSIEMWAWSCQRCDHLWLPAGKTEAPRICPSCKSSRWQHPRQPAPLATFDRRVAAGQRKQLRASGAAAQLAARDGSRCRYCRVELTEFTATIEHLVPLCRGGTNDPGNLGLACQPCNSEKGTMTESEYLAMRDIA